MYEMIEAGLRCGMTQTCKKVGANNEYMSNDCNRIEIKKVVMIYV